MKRILLCASLIAIFGEKTEAIHLKNAGDHMIQAKAVIKSDRGGSIIREKLSDDTAPDETTSHRIAGFINSIGNSGTLKVTIYDTDPHRMREHASCSIKFAEGGGADIDQKTITYDPQKPEGEECQFNEEPMSSKTDH